MVNVAINSKQWNKETMKPNEMKRNHKKKWNKTDMAVAVQLLMDRITPVTGAVEKCEKGRHEKAVPAQSVYECTNMNQSPRKTGWNQKRRIERKRKRKREKRPHSIQSAYSRAYMQNSSGSYSDNDSIPTWMVLWLALCICRCMHGFKHSTEVSHTNGSKKEEEGGGARGGWMRERERERKKNEDWNP